MDSTFSLLEKDLNKIIILYYIIICLIIPQKHLRNPQNLKSELILDKHSLNIS